MAVLAPDHTHEVGPDLNIDPNLEVEVTPDPNQGVRANPDPNPETRDPDPMINLGLDLLL